MARKFPFGFEFDEDADPVDELHRLREASIKHFKTLKAIVEYHSTLPTPKEMLAEVEEELAGKRAKTKAARARKVKPVRMSAPDRPRKTAKRLTHA